MHAYAAAANLEGGRVCGWLFPNLRLVCVGNTEPKVHCSKIDEGGQARARAQAEMFWLHIGQVRSRVFVPHFVATKLLSAKFAARFL